jgi:hypothetical protein
MTDEELVRIFLRDIFKYWALTVEQSNDNKLSMVKSLVSFLTVRSRVCIKSMNPTGLAPTILVFCLYQTLVLGIRDEVCQQKGLLVMVGAVT